MRQLDIDRFHIDDDSDAFVIAEIGHNHQGNLDRAKELFRLANEAGADAVKLQKRENRVLYTKAFYDSHYDSENSYGPTYGSHREALEFGWDEYVELKAHAKELGITFFATAFDFPSADFLEKLDLPAYKMASADLTNIPLIKHVASFNKPLLVSTGGGTMADVERVYDTIKPINRNLCILQCTASYPAEPEDLNLSVITTFRERFPDVVIGCSDHQNGIAMSVVAYVLGARVIEKHFTRNRAWKGTDQAFSLEPIGLSKLTRDLHRVRQALGTSVKGRLSCEVKPLEKMGKQLVAARDLPAGHVLAAEDIAVKSPRGGGLPPYELDNVIGQKTLHALAEDDSIVAETLGGVHYGQ